MMQSNEYSSVYDDYNGSSGQQVLQSESSPAANNNMIGGILEDDDQGDGGLGLENNNAATAAIDFNDPKIASLPRILLMGPRRGGKTSIQVRAFEVP